MATNAARAVDLFSKLSGSSLFNFESEEEYIREKELELQKVFESHGATTDEFKLSLRRIFDVKPPTEDYIYNKFKAILEGTRAEDSTNDLEETQRHDDDVEEVVEPLNMHDVTVVKSGKSIDNSILANNNNNIFMANIFTGHGLEIIKDTISRSEMTFDGSQINTDSNIEIRGKYNIIFMQCLDQLQKKCQITLVNQSFTNKKKQLSAKYVLVLAVDQSEFIRNNERWFDIIDLLPHKKSVESIGTLCESCFCNRDSEQAMLSYEQYSRAPEQFEIKEMFLVREDLLCDLQQYEQSRNLDQSFRETIHVMHVRGFDDDQLLVQDQKITETWTNNELTWLYLPNIPTCLVVFAVAAAETRGYCPWHPLKDPCTVQKRTEEIDIYIYICKVFTWRIRAFQWFV